MKHTILFGTLSAILITSGALAQSTTQGAASNSTQQTAAPNQVTSSNPSTEGQGISVAESARFAVRFSKPKPADLMTSKLVGIDIYNRNNERLGTIEDLAIENGRLITGVVVSVGGFLGLGERYVLVDPGTVVVSERDGNWTAYLDTNKDTLKAAPEFHYSKKKS